MNVCGNSQTQIPDDAEICERKVTISNSFCLLEKLWVFHTSTSVLLKIFVRFSCAGITNL